MTTISQRTTHDLWIEARKFELAISRPTPTTIQIDVVRPLNVTATDGAVVTLSTTALNPNRYPNDGTQYVAASTVFGLPGVARIPAVTDGAQVVGFYSQILSLPFPAGTPNATGTSSTFSITVTGTDPNTLYYASVHAATNVLQYYPIGIQSYPLEASRIEKDSSSYAGSLPSLPSAPTDPAPGFVYFDQGLNLVQYWDSVRSVWIPTRTDTIASDDTNPGVPGQTYLLSASRLMMFDGVNWEEATPANLQLRQGAGWIPFTTVSARVGLPLTANAGDVFYNYTSQRVEYWDGTGWQIPTPSSSLYITSNGPIPAFIPKFTIEAQRLPAPYVGLLFYNTKLHQLSVYTGSTWEDVNTDQRGTAITDKKGIGNDGSYDERLRLISILKSQLGWPTVCVELTEEHFNIAIDNALDTYRQLSIGAYEQRFIFMTGLRNQSTYFLNSPIDRSDAVVSVMKVHRLNLIGIQGSGPDNTWGQLFAQQFYNNAAGGYDLLSSHLVHGWAEEFTKLFAGDIPFVWNEARRELFLKRAIRTNERLLLEVEMERSEQELLLDRWCKQFLQNWGLAECKKVLGLIRSKYSSGTPGPAGTITLNGETLLAEARQDFAELKQSLLDYENQNSEHGNLAFLMG